MGTPATTQNVNLSALADTNVEAIKGHYFKGKAYYVDGTNGTATGDGLTWQTAMSTITLALAAASQGDAIFIVPKEVAATDTDPSSYAETLTITTPGIALIGISRGRTQGGLPQIKKGSGSTALLTVRAPGCLIANIGFNGGSSTGGGILLDDDGSTKNAWGTTILNCHFKNCVGTTATNAATGGAIQVAATGGAWQVLIKGCRFYKNVGDIVFKGTSAAIPQDIVIEDCVFSGPAASVDCNIYAAADGVNGLIIRDCYFTCNPNIGSGTNASFLVLTGCVGLLANNYFAAQTAEGVTTEIKFGATAENLVPTTMFMAHNFGEFPTGVGAGLVSGEIFRT